MNKQTFCITRVEHYVVISINVWIMRYVEMYIKTCLKENMKLQIHRRHQSKHIGESFRKESKFTWNGADRCRQSCKFLG